jgi:hypothetical protein
MKKIIKCDHYINFFNSNLIKEAYCNNRCCQYAIMYHIRSGLPLMEDEFNNLLKTEIFEICEAVLKRCDAPDSLIKSKVIDIGITKKYNVDVFGFGGAYGLKLE